MPEGKEWMNIPALVPEQPERHLHMERYEYAATVLEGKRVLDMACGMGYGTDILCRGGCSAEGLDIDPDAIDLAKQQYPGVTYHVGDIQSWIYPEFDFDAVVSFETLEHLERPGAAIDRLPDMIVKEIIASVPIRPTVGWNPWHKSDFTKDSFREMFTSRGFTIVHEIPQMWVDGADLYLMVHAKR